MQLVHDDIYLTAVRALEGSYDEEASKRLFQSLPTNATTRYLGSDDCPQYLIDFVIGMYRGTGRTARQQTLRSKRLCAIAKRRFNTPEVWDALYKTENKFVREELAKSPYTPREIYVRLSRLSSRQVKVNLIENNAVPFEDVETVLTTILSATRQHIAMSFENELLYYAAIVLRDTTVEDRERLLRLVLPPHNPGYETGSTWMTKHERLMGRLLDDSTQYSDVVSYVASILYGGPREILERRNRRFHLAGRALAHPSLPEEDFRAIHRRTIGRTKEDSLALLGCVVTSHSCPPDILEEACLHPYEEIRILAARHWNCPDSGRVSYALLRPQEDIIEFPCKR